MGCPMFEKKVVLQRPTDYPFQSLYRPWSWILSSFSNLIIFAILILLIYALIKKKRRQVKKLKYRRVICQDCHATKHQVPVLVTGGSGSLGQCLVRHLVADGGYEVHSLDLAIPDDLHRIPGVTSYIEVNIVDKDELVLALKEVQPEVVFHVAGLVPSVKTKDTDLFQVNGEGTEHIVEICKGTGVKRLVYTSTCDVLMAKEPSQVLELANETHPLPKQPLNAYCASKLQGEKVVLDANNGNDFATCVLRCSIIAGINSALFRALLHNQAVYIGSGTNKHCLVEINSCAEGHILAEKKLQSHPSLVAGEVYHLSGDVYQVKDLVGYTIDDSQTTIWGYSPPYSIPKWLAYIAAMFNVCVSRLIGYVPIDPNLNLNAVEFFCRSYTFSGDKAHQELGWPEHLSWQEVVCTVIEESENKKQK